MSRQLFVSLPVKDLEQARPSFLAGLLFAAAHGPGDILSLNRFM